MKNAIILLLVLAIGVAVLLGPSFLILAQKSQTAVTNGYYIEQSVLQLLLGLLVGIFSTALNDSNGIIKQSEGGKSLPKFLNLFMVSLIIFVAVQIYLLVVSGLAIRLAEWISHPLFRFQHKLGSDLLYSFLAWLIGFSIGYGIQSIPRIHKKIFSLFAVSKITEQSPVQAEVDDLQAVQAYCRAAAQEWWKSNDLESAICDKCNGSVGRNTGYIIGSWLYCGECENMFSEQYRSYLKNDPNFYGRGVLEKAKALVRERS
jgi:hypothetical protein